VSFTKGGYDIGNLLTKESVQSPPSYLCRRPRADNCKNLDFARCIQTHHNTHRERTAMCWLWGACTLHT